LVWVGVLQVFSIGLDEGIGMALKIGKYTSSGSSIGVRAPEHSNIEIGSAEFHGSGIDFDIYESSIYAQLGLPSSAPPELVKELVDTLIKNQNAPVEVQERLVASSRLAEVLKLGGSAVALGTNVIAFVKGLLS